MGARVAVSPRRRELLRPALGHRRARRRHRDRLQGRRRHRQQIGRRCDPVQACRDVAGPDRHRRRQTTGRDRRHVGVADVQVTCAVRFCVLASL